MRVGQITFQKGATEVIFGIPSSITQPYVLNLPAAPPEDGKTLRWNADLNALEWIDEIEESQGGGIESITSEAEGLVASTEDGNAVLNWVKNQPANVFLATPSGGTGSIAPRKIVPSDVPELDASKIGTGSFSSSQMPSGTDAAEWQIDKDGKGVKLVAGTDGMLTLFKDDGTTLATIKVGKIIADEEEIDSSTTIESHDTKILLNSDFTEGTPNEDMGIEGKRGKFPSARMLWIEAEKIWKAGVEGAMYALGRKTKVEFTNADLNDGELIWTHNLNTNDLTFTTWMNNGKSIGIEATLIDLNSVSFDLESIGEISGTWKIVATI